MHANAGNLKRQLEQRCCNDDAERLPGFRGDSIRFCTPAVRVRDDLRRTSYLAEQGIRIVSRCHLPDVIRTA